MLGAGLGVPRGARRHILRRLGCPGMTPGCSRVRPRAHDPGWLWVNPGPSYYDRTGPPVGLKKLWTRDYTCPVHLKDRLCNWTIKNQLNRLVFCGTGEPAGSIWTVPVWHSRSLQCSMVLDSVGCAAAWRHGSEAATGGPAGLLLWDSRCMHGAHHCCCFGVYIASLEWL